MCGTCCCSNLEKLRIAEFKGRGGSGGPQDCKAGAWRAIEGSSAENGK